MRLVGTIVDCMSGEPIPPVSAEAAFLPTASPPDPASCGWPGPLLSGLSSPVPLRVRGRGSADREGPRPVRARAHRGCGQAPESLRDDRRGGSGDDGPEPLLCARRAPSPVAPAGHAAVRPSSSPKPPSRPSTCTPWGSRGAPTLSATSRSSTSARVDVHRPSRSGGAQRPESRRWRGRRGAEGDVRARRAIRTPPGRELRQNWRSRVSFTTSPRPESSLRRPRTSVSRSSV